eukprot:1935665-Amphidinium_carterae.1
MGMEPRSECRRAHSLVLHWQLPEVIVCELVQHAYSRRLRPSFSRCFGREHFASSPGESPLPKAEARQKLYSPLAGMVSPEKLRYCPVHGNWRRKAGGECLRLSHGLCSFNITAACT